MNIRHFSFNPYQTNCFVAWEEEGTCIVVDPSFRSGAESGFTQPDKGFSTTDISDGETITAAGLGFKVITTPGHTPGSVCYLNEKYGVMFTGDTLFAGSIGRTDLPMGEYDDLIRSIMDKLMGLDGDTDILPGHGGRSSIGWERTHNPFLEPFNEKEEEYNPE